MADGTTYEQRFPFWGGTLEEQRAWDTCKIDGITLTNVTVTCPKERKMDVKQSPGKSGAKFTDKGYMPATVTIEVQINTQEEWDFWCGTVLPALDPERLDALRRPLKFVHPEANSRGIHVIYINKIKGGKPSASKGKLETIEATHWVPEPKQTKAVMTAPKKPNMTPAGPPPDQVFNNLADKIAADSVAPDLPHNTFYSAPNTSS